MTLFCINNLRLLKKGWQWQHLKKGFFIEPTVVTEVTCAMKIWREEVLGPVLCVKTFNTEEEALDLANDSP